MSAPPGSSLSSSPAGETAHRPTILVVDDEEAIVELVVATLRRAPYRILTASNGEQALEVARASRPDLVLLDVGMPGLDGFDVCLRLKTDPETSRAIVFMLTARSLPEDRARGIAVGADGYLGKPFKPADLLARIGERLGG